MLKKIVVGILVVMLLVSMVGCGNTAMTDEQLISAVKNSHFENHSQKTIGEYFDLYEELSGATVIFGSMDKEKIKEIPNATNALKNFNESKEYLVSCMAFNQADDEIILILFTCDKNNKNVIPIYCTLSRTRREDARFTEFAEKAEINNFINMFVNMIS